MDWPTFITKLVESLIWPVVVLTLLLYARPYWGDLFTRLEQLKLPGGAELKFQQVLAEAKQLAKSVVGESGTSEPSRSIASDEPFLELARKFPVAAILEAYREVERALTEWQKANPADKDLRGSTADIVRMLKRKKFIGQDVVELFDSVTETSNAAVRLNQKSIKLEEVLEYRSVCRELLQSLAEGLDKYSES